MKKSYFLIMMALLLVLQAQSKRDLVAEKHIFQELQKYVRLVVSKYNK